MAILNIAQIGNPVLRKKARKVSLKKLKSKGFQELIDDMVETMRDASGVGLAANQVRSLSRVVLLEVKDNSRYPNAKNIPLKVFVNPRVAQVSEEIIKDWEGCLSINLFGLVPRPRSIVVEALTRGGKKIKVRAGDFYARILQHEIDHLDGILFLDRLRDLSTLTAPAEYNKLCGEIK